MKDKNGKINDNIKPKKKKRRLKKKVLIFLFLIILSISGVSYYLIHDAKVKKQQEEEKRIIDNINSHYNKFVKVDKDSKLFIMEQNKYQEAGIVYANQELTLGDTMITLDTKYFPIENSKYYIEYNNLSKIDEIKEYDQRYKNYLPFNENIVTNGEFTLYDADNKVITLKEEMTFPIIINNYENKYYVEYDNRLLNIKKEDVKEIVKSENTKKKNQSNITTFAYHRIYDTTDKCTDSYICLKKASFDKQMKYLKDNNYFTLNMRELYMYLKGNLQVEKATVITFDDGYLFTAADEVLRKYDLHGTMFVISGHFQEYSRFENLTNISIESHTHSMHKNYQCSGGSQGGAILCASHDAIVKDLKLSCEKLGIEPFALAFPFYDYNDHAISALKDAGFKISFIGRAGKMGKATPKVTDTYKVPRMTVYDDNLMGYNKWKSYL